MAPGDFVFAHLADAHVGAWPRDAAVRSALRAAVVRALDVVRERRAEFLLVSGDLFHTPVPDPVEVAPVAAALRKLVQQGTRIYLIYGSHDYVAHRTSWLDVLAETGIFVRVAPEAVRADDASWTLPFVVDPPTGAVIAGVSGRSHGLDREYFRRMDARDFRAQPGFKVFMFHAAVNEHLPEGLREHIRGVALDELPAGADYYAAGHIHRTYLGTGPSGGLLINPGAVFGTSLSDIEAGTSGATRQGVVLVRVERGEPEAEFVPTVRPGELDVFDIDVSGKTAEQARAVVREVVTQHAASGVLLFPRVLGAVEEASASGLGLAETNAEAESRGAVAVHWDLRDTTSPLVDSGPGADRETDLERFAIRELAAGLPVGLLGLDGPDAESRLMELLRDLGSPPGEGESRQDYRNRRVESALGLLGLRHPMGSESARLS